MIESDPDGIAGAEIADFASELSQSVQQASADLDRFNVPELSSSIPGPTGLADFSTLPLNPMVMEIPVTMKVVLGTARMPVAAVSKLARGSIVKLDNRVGDPVDVFVNGRLLARGEVVVLDDAQSRFGVKLIEVGETKEKMR